MNSFISRCLLLLAIIFFTCSNGWSKHIIGGEITYECLGVDTVRNQVSLKIKTTLYRDGFGGGAQFDPIFTFGIYYYNNTSASWEYYFDRNAENVPVCCQRILDVNENDPCVEYPKNVIVEEGKYIFDVTLPIRNTSYMIVYQRCCRNNSISNIYRPGDQGAAYTVEITPESQRLCNNSPVFKSFPPLVICADFPLNYDHSAYDKEGDLLVYEFCTPLHAGGKLGTGGAGPCVIGNCDCVIPDPSFCRPPYSTVDFKIPQFTPQYPMGGSPRVRIDGNTGLISGTPRIKGQFVVGVCVSEYRNGILLSQVRRDFQFNVTNCNPLVVADVKHDLIQEGKYVINSCGLNTVNFENQSFNKKFIRSYEWQFDLKGNYDTLQEENVQMTFPDTGTYDVIMILNKGLSCSDTARIQVNIFPDINAAYTFDYDTCNPTPVIFNDQSKSGAGPIIEWDWDFSDGGISTTKDPTHLFKTPGVKKVLLKVKDQNECVDIVEKEIAWYPVPGLIIIDPSNFKGCKPAAIKFINLSTPIDSTYDVIWDFGDGTTVNEISPIHLFEEEGIYTIRIDITSPIGCTTSAEYTDWIKIVDAPEADFDYSPKELSNFNKKVFFTDQSKRASGWQWIFDNSAALFEQNPMYTFRDTGVHEIKLIAFHENGCTDTIIKYIDVVPSVTYFMPNAFTPNGDGKNDEFRGIGYVEGISQFRMSIWNRWGEELFHTNNPESGWNGLYRNNGIAAPSGVYLYTVEYIGPRGGRQVLKGYATLIR